MKSPSLKRYFARGILACMLACATAPCLVAFGEETDDGGAAASTLLEQAFSQANEDMLQRFNVTGNPVDLLTTYSANGFGAGSGIMTLDESNFPAAFDLRDTDKVTPVKFQNPWGTCWGFAAIAASETSILSSTGDVASSGLDLSELQLAWFTYTPLSADSVSKGDVNTESQIDEGYYAVDANGNWSTDASVVLNVGGTPPASTSMLSSGTGPIAETLAPYKNKKGIIQYNQKNEPLYYSTEGDWSVDPGLRFASSFQLLNGNMLPSPAVRNANQYVEYNQAGTDAIKQELTNGRAVLINFAADDSVPGVQSEAKYINYKTYAHYTYDDKSATHAVTIVGWDDTYSASKFLDEHQPPADGAWIVKNSWGAKDNEFPNKYDWGYDGSGYFYLSYYDHSITNVETLEYDTSVPTEDGYHLIDQYDFLPSQAPVGIPFTEETATANVFTATERQTIHAVSCETAYPNTTVSYEIYLLNDGATKPKDGTLVATLTDDPFKYAGYHRSTLNEGVLVEKGQKYSVVATEKTIDDEGETVYSFQVDRDVNKEGYEFLKEHYPQNKYAIGIVNKGESFLITKSNGVESTLDWADEIPKQKEQDAVTYKMPFGPFDYDNFSLKAYASPTPIEYEDASATATIGEGDAALNVTVSGKFKKDSSPELRLNALDETAIKELLAASDKKQYLAGTDAKLIDTATGEELQYEGTLTLEFTLAAAHEGKATTIVHFPSNGGPTETTQGTVTQGKVSTTTSSLSPFGVFAQANAGGGASDTNTTGSGASSTVDTGDSSALPATVAAVMAALSVCVITIAHRYRHRHKRTV